MTLAKPERLTELIDPDRSWAHWYGFLREHPSYLREVIERLPAATSHEQAVHKTRMIGWWANQQGDQMCRAGVMQRAEQMDYLVGVQFADNPYGQQKGSASVGLYYLDPFLVENPITWDMVDRELLRDEQGRVLDFERILNAPEHDGASPYWVERMNQAEREWFSESQEAPVIVVQWRCDKLTQEILDHVDMDLWDATEEVLSMTGMERRQINGFRRLPREYPPKLRKPRHPMKKNRNAPYSLAMHIHAPSQALMAYREAVRLDGATVDTGMYQGSTRRL